MNFVERRFTIKYFTFFDILTRIGGFRASIMPFINYLAPLVVLYFLIKLAKIIKDHIKDIHQTELKDFTKWSLNKLKQL